MKREQVIATLRAHEAELRGYGVRHGALFGSVARGEERPKSDIDILVELDPQRPIDLFATVALAQFPADLFPARVDVANRGGLKPLVPSCRRARRHPCFLTGRASPCSIYATTSSRSRLRRRPGAAARRGRKRTRPHSRQTAKKLEAVNDTTLVREVWNFAHTIIPKIRGQVGGKAALNCWPGARSCDRAPTAQ